MTFPGYLKSLRLSDKHNDISESTSESQNAECTDSTKRRVRDGERINSEKSTDTCISSPAFEYEEIIDERGNSPSKSLWVGNIPPRTTTSELRQLFDRFGTIVSTRPAAKYAFVNFDCIESAIAAFKQYHDRDIFNTGHSTINIRFTSSLTEAKQAKDDTRDGRPSMSTKAEAAQRQWFQPVGNGNDDNNLTSPDGVEWPNGKPPSGPKSQRREISPPPLRRHDSYRPATVSRQDSYRSDEYRWSEKDSHRRKRSRRDTLDQHYSPDYSPRHSRSSSRAASSTASPRRNRSRDDESPLPWERSKPTSQFRNLVWTKESQAVSGKDGLHDKLGDSGSNELGEVQVTDIVKEYETTMESPQAIASTSIKVQIQDCMHGDESQDQQSNALNGCRPSIEVTTDSLLRSTTNMSTAQAKSPSLRPIDRLRLGSENLRGSSVPSEVATSSSKTSTRKRRCHDCKKPSTDLSPFTPCSICRRKFHPSCGDPKPSSYSDKTKYVCGGCQRKTQLGVVSVSATAAEARKQAKINEKVHLVSPPLSTNYDGSGSANLSPRDDLSYIISCEKTFESFFTEHTEDTETPANNGTNQPSLNPDRNDSTSTMSYFNPHPHQHSSVQSTPTLKAVFLAKKSSGLQKKNKYKSVTCKWWASNSCSQPEDECYYAHNYTGISVPDRKKVNKHWTCYDWLYDKCPKSDRDCLHAHSDTGLHIWKDGRPSFKHVTCHWWLVGRCKWDERNCKFAHEDTGLYSLDPAERWAAGGSKFTVVSPVEGLGLYVQQHNSEVSLSSSQQHRQRDSIPKGPKESLPRSPGISTKAFNNTQERTATVAGTKPSLTINTLNNTSTRDIQLATLSNTPLLNTLGAPPQTPSDESSDKNYPRIFQSMQRSTSMQKAPELPTPAFEDTTENEDGLQDYVTLSRKSWNKVVDDREKSNTKSTAVEQPELITKRHDSESGAHCTLLNRRENHVDDYTDERGNIVVSKDPRLQRHGRLSTNSADLKDTTTIVSDAAPLTRDLDMPEVSRDLRPPTRDETSRPGVKKCQNCQKIVFGTDLCRTCSSNKIMPTTNKTTQQSSNQPQEPVVVKSPADQEPTIIPNTTIVQKNPKPVPEVTTNASSELVSKNSLKRSASGSNIFLKNKRPKSSMIFSSSGSIRPDAFRRESTEKRPPSNSTNTEVRRQPQQTLEDLILEERARNDKKRTSLVPEITNAQSPAGEGGEGDHVPESPEEQPLAQIWAQNRTSNKEETPIGDSTDTRILPAGTDLFSSPPQSSPPNQSAAPVKSIDLNQVSRPLLEVSKIRGPSNRPSRDVSEWRSSESPEPVRKSMKLPVKSISVLEPAIMRREKTQPVSPAQKRLVMPHRQVSRESVISPSKMSWATPLVCTQCQKQHKKCLHSRNGSLSPLKCREYVLSRNAKPDTGRSKREWQDILAVAELEPMSDDDDAEDENVEPELEEENYDEGDETSSDSEADYATAKGMNSDTMSITEKDAETDAALLDIFQKRARDVCRPTELMRSPTAVAKHFTRDRETGWSEADELVKRAALKKKGVMFESDSEDEDYLSEEHQPPTKRARPIDPLYVPPKFSQNLFEVAPELENKQVEHDQIMPWNIQRHKSRKEQWAKLRSHQLQERRARFGNPHWEVDRKHEDLQVEALVERVLAPKNQEDRFAVGTMQTKEEQISFAEFLGAPKQPEICLMNDWDTLAFQDGQKENERGFGRTARGLCKRATDDEKWPIRMK